MRWRLLSSKILSKHQKQRTEGFSGSTTIGPSSTLTPRLLFTAEPSSSSSSYSHSSESTFSDLSRNFMIRCPSRPSFSLLLPNPASPSLNLRDLTGFDNTGNVRLWPGSEGLALLLLKESARVRHKVVLEVGAGAVGLPSFAAIAAGARQVTATDGNERAVEQLRHLKNFNNLQGTLEVRQLFWGKEAQQQTKYDVILAADCVFFEDRHEKLLITLKDSLNEDGEVVMCCPERKGSLNKWRERVREDGFFEIVERSDFAAAIEAALVYKPLDLDLEWPVLMILKKK